VQGVSLFSQEEEIEPFQDVFVPHKGEEIESCLPQLCKYDLLEEFFPFVHCWQQAKVEIRMIVGK
jgi:hypothetical protein